MFKNALLFFSLLCGFLSPNHISAYSVVAGNDNDGANTVPIAYSFSGENPTETSAIKIVTPFDNYTNAIINSVEIDSTGNAIIVGYATFASVQVPLVYSLIFGETTATLITTSLPSGYSTAVINSVAINSTGDAIIVGYANNGTTNVPLVYSLLFGESTATRIEISLPSEHTDAEMRGVAFDNTGNAIIVGNANNGTTNVPLVYSLPPELTAATVITTPSTNYTDARIKSVAINTAGQAVIIGKATLNSNVVPLVYSFLSGATTASLIEMPFSGFSPATEGVDRNILFDVAIGSAGNAVIVGQAKIDAENIDVPIAYSLLTGSTAATMLTVPTPAGRPNGVLRGVAIDSSENAIMTGDVYALVTDANPSIPINYSLALGATTAIEINTPTPTGYTDNHLMSVSFDSAENAVMVGDASFSSNRVPLLYSLLSRETTATHIGALVPTGYTNTVTRNIASATTSSGGVAFFEETFGGTTF